MKTARYLGRHVATQGKQADLNKLSSLMEPGKIVSSIDGSHYRVASKVSTADGFKFRLADLQGKPVQTPADFHPVTAAFARTAAWMRFVFAYNADFDMYVKEYIKEAGLPVDPKMNWAKWFQYTYAPKLSGITQDPEVVDEAIHQVLITSLAKRKDLTKFDASRLPAGAQAQPLQEQVTTYLQWLLKKRVSEAYEYIKEKLQPAQEVSMNQPGNDGASNSWQGAGEETDYNLLDTEEHATPGGQAEAEEAADLSRLRDQFAAWLQEDESPNEIKKLLVLYDFFTQHIGRKLKISDYKPYWTEKTGLGEDSLKPSYAKFKGYIPEFMVAAGMISADKAKARGMAQKSSLASLTLAGTEEIPGAGEYTGDNAEVVTAGGPTSDSQVLPVAGQGPSDKELQENSHTENGGSPVLDGDLHAPERPNVNAMREALDGQDEAEVGMPIVEKEKELAQSEAAPGKTVEVNGGESGAKIIININAAGSNCTCGHHKTYHDGKNKMCHGGTKENPCNCDGRFKKEKAAGDQDAVDRTGDKEEMFNPKADFDPDCPECGHETRLHTLPYGCCQDLGDAPGGEGDRGPYGSYARGDCGCMHGLQDPELQKALQDNKREYDLRHGRTSADDTGRMPHNPEAGGARTGPDGPIVVDEKTAAPVKSVIRNRPAPAVKSYGTSVGEKKDTDVLTDPNAPGAEETESGTGYQEQPRRKTVMPELPNAEMILQLNASGPADETEQLRSPEEEERPFNEEPDYYDFPKNWKDDENKEAATPDVPVPAETDIAAPSQTFLGETVDKGGETLYQVEMTIPGVGPMPIWLPLEMLSDEIKKQVTEGTHMAAKEDHKVNCPANGGAACTCGYTADQIAKRDKEKKADGRTLDEIQAPYSGTLNELHQNYDIPGAITEPLYVVYREGGSLGEQKGWQSEPMSRDEAAGKASRMNKSLSPGEKKYYRIKYKIRKASAMKTKKANQTLDDLMEEFAQFDQFVWLSGREKGMIFYPNSLEPGNDPHFRGSYENHPQFGDIPDDLHQAYSLVDDVANGRVQVFDGGTDVTERAKQLAEDIDEELNTAYDPEQDEDYEGDDGELLDEPRSLNASAKTAEYENPGFRNSYCAKCRRETKHAVRGDEKQCTVCQTLGTMPHKLSPDKSAATIDPKVGAPMATTPEKRAALREKIAARRKERETVRKDKYARLKQVAADEPQAAGEGLEQLAGALGELAQGLEALRENLDLVDAPAEAPLKDRIAARRAFAVNFRQTADENPELLEGALKEVYQSVDEVAVALENYAENLGVDLTAPAYTPPVPGNDAIEEIEVSAPAEEPKEEKPAEEEKKPEEVKEAATGADAFSSDRDHDGHPKEAKVDETMMEANKAKGAGELHGHEHYERESCKSAPACKPKSTQKEATSGSDNFITDRDDKGEPKAPQRVEVPRLAAAAARVKKIVAAAEAAAARHKK
jgi:hypothetical protein